MPAEIDNATPDGLTPRWVAYATAKPADPDVPTFYINPRMPRSGDEHV